MRTRRHDNIKNSQNNFFNTMINIRNFDPNLLSIDQVLFKGADCVIYNIMKINTWFLLLQTRIKKH